MRDEILSNSINHPMVTDRWLYVVDVMKKLFVITALTYRAMTSGYYYDLTFEIRGKPCLVKSAKQSFEPIQCEGIDGWGLIADGYLSWYDCLSCGASDRKPLK